MKKFLLVLLILAIIVGGVLWNFRYDIFQYSAETIIKNLLPSYVHVDRLIFDLKNRVLQVQGFSIQNPRGFQNRYLATIDSITCRYRMRGSNVLDGIEITDIEAYAPLIYIERLPDGRINLNETGKMMEEEAPKEVAIPQKEVKQAPKEVAMPQKEVKQAPFGEKGKIGGRKISDIIKLTNTIDVKDGKFSFLDKAVSRNPYYLTFEGIEGIINLSLNSDYTAVETAGTNGYGFVNGDRSQRVSWVVSMNPNTPELTMSNRIEPENIDIMLFKPYYDRYSPIDIQAGRFSGSLVFDFDNGNIGSMNTLSIRGLKFREREGGFASGFWDTSVSDVIKYLENSQGEVEFDFKIKGTMQNPRFLPGPHVQQAIQSMAVAKISQLLAPKDEQQAQAAGAQQQAAPKSDAERVIDLIQGLMQKGN